MAEPPKKYGDERDDIRTQLRAMGGHSFLIHDALKSERLRKTHEPKPYSADLEEEEKKTDFISPLGKPPKKVTIVGCGQVGLAIAYALLAQGIPGMIALTDVAGEKLEGEAKDFQQGAAFLNKRVLIAASTDYEVTANSDLVIVTAGAAQRPGESRLSLVGRNVNIMRSIIPQVLKYSPDAPICIVANPCDIMTAVAAKIAGPSVPPGRIFGSGTTLDSGRFCALIASSLNVDTRSVQGFVIGEHGDSSVPVWSSVRVGGIPFLETGERLSQTHDELRKAVVTSAGEVIQKKGYTNWAVGLAVAHLADVVISDERRVMPVSTCVRGMKGVVDDVFISVPCVVGAHGVVSVVDIPLDQEELNGFHRSVEAIWDVQSGVWDEV